MFKFRPICRKKTFPVKGKKEEAPRGASSFCEAPQARKGFTSSSAIPVYWVNSVIVTKLPRGLPNCLRMLQSRLRAALRLSPVMFETSLG